MTTRRVVSGTVLPALLFLVSCSSPKVAESRALETRTSIPAQAAEIARGAEIAERRESITRRLASLGITFRTQAFSGKQGEGTNILASLPGSGARTVMLAAHYDRVVVGQGAVDNAAGCALVLELLDRLGTKPLRNLTVVAAFFDQEEKKMLGSKYFVASSSKQSGPEERLPSYCLVFDIFAYGDTLWMSGPDKESPLAAAGRESASAAKFPLRESESYPPGDHLPFLHAGVDTAAVSLLPGQEIEEVRDFIAGRPPADPPRVLQVIHTPRDRISEVHPKDIEKALPVIEGWLRKLDARAAGGPVSRAPARAGGAAEGSVSAEDLVAGGRPR